MKVSIGLITSQPHIPNLQIVESRLNKLCNIKYLIINKNDDIISHFIENFNEVDAFVFSGTLLHKYLTQNVDTAGKPCYVIYDYLANVYKEIFSIFMHNPHIEPNRVYIDFVNKDYIHEFEDIFQPDNMPYVFAHAPEDPLEYVEFVRNNHLRLWREKKIDLSITRFGMLTEELDKEGVNYHFIHPPVEYLMNLFMSVINEIKLMKLESNMMATVYIAPVAGTYKYLDNLEMDIKLLSIQRELLNLIKEGTYDFIIQSNSKRIEMHSTIEELMRLTDQFNTCEIRNFLKRNIDIDFSVGYGSGKNPTISKVNAQKAFAKSEESGGQYSYYKAEDIDSVICLGGENPQGQVFKSNPFVDSLATKLDLNPTYLYKTIIHATKIQSNKYTSQNLSSLLGISTRSGNRILNKLVEKGVATVNHIKNESKGRPIKEYRLLFLENDGSIKFS